MEVKAVVWSGHEMKRFIGLGGFFRSGNDNFSFKKIFSVLLSTENHTKKRLKIFLPE